MTCTICQYSYVICHKAIYVSMKVQRAFILEDNLIVLICFIFLYQFFLIELIYPYFNCIHRLSISLYITKVCEWNIYDYQYCHSVYCLTNIFPPSNEKFIKVIGLVCRSKLLCLWKHSNVCHCVYVCGYYILTWNSVEPSIDIYRNKEIIYNQTLIS